MANIAAVDPGAASTHARQQPQQAPPADYGAAVTHRDAVREKQRVDPVSLADKKRHAHEARDSDPPRHSHHHERKKNGRLVDIRV
ncbi:MAG: hypothetical protein R3C25_10085 [Hyphomonadaceae bacterium]